MACRYLYADIFVSASLPVPHLKGKRGKERDEV
jgi:hypothetical protein